MTEDVKLPTDKAEELIGSFNPSDRQDVAAIKYAAKSMVNVIEINVPDGRRKSIALTHIEDAAMMAVKALYS